MQVEKKTPPVTPFPQLETSCLVGCAYIFLQFGYVHVCKFVSRQTTTEAFGHCSPADVFNITVADFHAIRNVFSKPCNNGEEEYKYMYTL